jgi:hypothetical protein
MRRFSRRKRGAAESNQSSIDAGQWLPKILELGRIEVPSLEAWADPEVPSAIAAIGRGERADGTKVIVAFSPKSATEAMLGGLAAAQFAVEKMEFAGQLVIVAPQWPSAARRLLGQLGRTPYAVEPIEAPSLASGRKLVEAEPLARVLATNAAQLSMRIPAVEARTAFSRAAVALEGLAAKHGGSVRVGIDRLELVVLARRVAEIRMDGERAVLETQIGGRSTTPLAGADLAGEESLLNWRVEQSYGGYAPGPYLAPISLRSMPSASMAMVIQSWSQYASRWIGQGSVWCSKRSGRWDRSCPCSSPILHRRFDSAPRACCWRPSDSRMDSSVLFLR